MAFLPKDYEAPQNSGANYVRLESGEAAKFRVVSSPLFGWEVWTEDVEGRKVHRREYTHEGYDALTSISTDRPKHFWSLIVWDIAMKKLVIWHITQRSIKEDLTALSKSDDWGDPVNYDLRITRTGKGLETKWTVTPVPPIGSPPPEALTGLKDVDLEEVLRGGDPFAARKKGDDIPF